MTLKERTNDNRNILFHSNINTSEETIESNLWLGPFCGKPYPFFKSLR